MKVTYLAVVFLSLLFVWKPVLAKNTEIVAENIVIVEGKELQCPENASEIVCDAFKSGFCVQGISVDACSEKLKTIGIGQETEISHFFKELGSKLTEGVLAFISAVLATLLAALLAIAKTKITKLTSRLGDPVLKDEKNVNFKTTGVNLLIVGEGGSGKTSIIRSLSGSPDAAPSKSTAYPTTYSIVHEVDVNKGQSKGYSRNLERIYANDYKGQDAAQLNESNELKNREVSIPSTVLLIVVDLFEVPTKGEEPLFFSKSYDKRRVKYQISAYPENLLDILYGLTNHLHTVVLFINKIDKIRPLEEDSEKLVREAYKGLISKLHKKGKHFEFEVIVGSAASGWGVCGFNPDDKNRPTLYELLKNAMVKINV